MPANSYYLPSRKLVSQDDASLIQRARVPRSRFDNRWSRLTTFDAGYLVPFMIDEIYPGDHMRYNVTAYVRMSTALFPMYSNQRLDTHFFFVPWRIIWANWNKFMGEQADPTASISYTFPQMDTGAAYAVGSLHDHLGLPMQGFTNYRHSCMPHRAYNRIWNDWFRDQNIQTEAYNNTNDGPDAAANYVLKRRAKSHDYFTSSLPWPQKFTAPNSLFTGTAPIIGIGALDGVADYTAGPLVVRETSGSTATYNGALSNLVDNNPPGPVQPGIYFALNNSAVPGAANPLRIYADLSQATGVTINALRQAWLVQDLLERDARGGTRYVEIIRSHFGVVSPDFRLQRSEYIGGGQTPINLTPIAQTTPTGGGGLGALGATGTSVGQHGASYAATEHGIIMGLISVKSEIHYQQGMHKMWTRQVRQDFYFPSLAGLGEQAVLRGEIYNLGTVANDTVVFGYQERWQELRTRYNEVTGLFRSTAAGNIDEWHLGQEFSAAPTLSDAFIRDEPPMTRVLAAGAAATNMQYLADIQIQRTAVRPVPMFGTPATLSRF